MKTQPRSLTSVLGIDVAVVNPAHARFYAMSKGMRHKTDKIDATNIAHFALEHQPESTKQRTENEIALKEFVALRRQLVKERTELKNQLEHATQRETVSITKSLIETLSKRMKKIEAIMEKLIKENSEWSKRKEILKSVLGIGTDTVRVLLTNMPELGEGNADNVSCLAGLAPLNRDSGKWRGKRSIFGGRSVVRATLHNVAMAAIFFTKTDNIFTQMYYRLKKELNKEHKVVLVAVAHKMLRIIHTLLKNGVKWENKLST
jgi:transposase